MRSEGRLSDHWNRYSRSLTSVCMYSNREEVRAGSWQPTVRLSWYPSRIGYEERNGERLNTELGRFKIVFVRVASEYQAW